MSKSLRNPLFAQISNSTKFTSLYSYMIRLVGPLPSFADPTPSKSGGVLSTTRLEGISVALNRIPEPQSVARASLFGPSISLITKRKSFKATGVTPSD